LEKLEAMNIAAFMSSCRQWWHEGGFGTVRWWLGRVTLHVLNWGFGEHHNTSKVLVQKTDML